jgi:hypothetical protein
MAYDEYGNWQDDDIYGPDFGLTPLPGADAWNGTTVEQGLAQASDGYRTSSDSPAGSTPYAGPDGNIDNVIGDTSGLEQQLRDYASQAGVSYDVSDMEGILRNTGYQTGGSSLDQALSNQFGIYDQRALYDGISVGDRDGASGTGAAGSTSGTGGGTGTSGTAGTGGTGNTALDAYMQYLLGRQGTADGYQSQVRDLLMQQMGLASQPVSATDAGLAPIIQSQQLALSRSAERQRSQAAARLAADGLGDSGTADTAMIGIEQQRGESEAGMIGQILYNELNNRRQQLTTLLQTAIASGDAQAAQNIQAQLAAISLQMQNSQYYAGLDNNRYQFDNDLGYRLLMAELLGNQNAVGAFL